MQTVFRSKVLNLLLDWSVPLVLGVIAIAVMLAGRETIQLLRYDRSEILSGELWRLLTGHLTHLGWSHLWLNLAGLVLVWLLCAKALSQRLWWLVLALCALGCSLGLLLWDTDLQWYVGLSGVLHGLLVAGALAGWVRGRRDNGLLLGAVALKLLWEQWQGPLPGSEAVAGGHVVVDAHLFGAITGLLVAVMIIATPAWRRRNLPAEDPSS